MGKVALPIFFGVFWTAIVGVFDLIILYNIALSLRAQTFAQTTGTVTHSEVTLRTGGRGSATHGVDVRYSYFVNGDKREGSNYHYGDYSSSDEAWAREAVRRHKVGTPVTVYYDAENPSESVLKPGVSASEVFLLLFMTPFNLIMLGIWYIGGSHLWHWWRGTKPEHVKWFREGGSTRVRLPDPPALAAGIGAAGIAAFVGVFVVAFSSGFHPSMPFVLTIWAIVLSVGLGTGIWLWQRERRGDFDLVIGDRSVELPAMFKRKRRETLDKGMIGGVKVETIVHQGKGGPSYTYAIKIERRSGGGEKVAEWHDQQSAEQLAAWLREKLNLRA